MDKKLVWKELIAQHRKLAATNRCNVYDRITILKRVHDDSYFAEGAKAEGYNNPVDYLNGELTDVCANFNELRHMLKLWPRRKQWEDGDLSAMRRDMQETLSAQVSKSKKSGTGERRSRNKPSWKNKYLELQDKLREVEQKYRILEASYKQLSKDYKELQAILTRQRKAS